MLSLCWIVILLLAIVILLYQGASLFISTATLGAILLLCSLFGGMVSVLLLVFWCLWALLALFNVNHLRLQLTGALLTFYRQVMPKMSQTEREALNAGGVWWDGALFSGNPDWQTLQAFPKPGLSEDEQAFIDGPVTALCRMLNDWEITQQHRDLPLQVWTFIREQGFFGLIIPKEYGGKGFSAQAHAAVLLKLFSCSTTAGSTVAVPNSLGPAELLLHYGTQAQKDYYLPRLAGGEEVPCFALTSPKAGSDATAMPDYGTVCEAVYEGKKTLGMRVTWDKRYITLCPIATVLGLAFKLYDPSHLLGEADYVGITCALIPTTHAGVVTGRRHHPAVAVFQNGPTQGKDVFIPIDWIIGGREMAGKGWRMLVECLSVGRSISLPTSGVASCKVSAAIASAYARVRRQFNLPIGRFEGVEEKLAQIAGLAYQAGAVSEMTLTAIDHGHIPAVPSAILKYHCTEMSREAMNHAMDILAGKAVCFGPSNPLALGFGSLPIAITVEGANILTRNMIIFGQGSIRCHPYVLKELSAAQLTDKNAALQAFDEAVWGHMAFALRNVARSLVHGLTGAYFAKTPKSRAQQYYQQFSRFSATFAVMTDACMAIYGGELKRKERVSARLGDVLSYLYLGSAVLKRFHDRNEPEAEWPLVKWCCHNLLYKIQHAVSEVLANLPGRAIPALLHFVAFPLGQRLRKPHDKLEHELAALMMSPSATRDFVFSGICADAQAHNQVALFEQALVACIEIEALEKELRGLKRDGKLQGHNFDEVVLDAKQKGIISAEAYQHWVQADQLRRSVIAVDDFDHNLSPVSA